MTADTLRLVAEVGAIIRDAGRALTLMPETATAADVRELLQNTLAAIGALKLRLREEEEEQEN